MGICFDQHVFRCAASLHFASPTRPLPSFFKKRCRLPRRSSQGVPASDTEREHITAHQLEYTTTPESQTWRRKMWKRRGTPTCRCVSARRTAKISCFQYRWVSPRVYRLFHRCVELRMETSDFQPKKLCAPITPDQHISPSRQTAPLKAEKPSASPPRAIHLRNWPHSCTLHSISPLLIILCVPYSWEENEGFTPTHSSGRRTWMKAEAKGDDRRYNYTRTH